MKMVIGLGNPGKKYELTRHNIGFLSIDKLASDIGVNSFTSTIAKYNALITEARFNGQRVLLVKPLTFMNLSGEAIRALIDWYKLEIEDILVIYDDLDLPTGKLRFREKGSAGGHNGIKSIIAHLGTENFKRVKVGIDRPKGISVVDYVLTNFSEEEKVTIDNSLENVSRSIQEWIKGEDFKKIMSTYSVQA